MLYIFRAASLHCRFHLAVVQPRPGAPDHALLCLANERKLLLLRGHFVFGHGKLP